MIITQGASFIWTLVFLFVCLFVFLPCSPNLLEFPGWQECLLFCWGWLLLDSWIVSGCRSVSQNNQAMIRTLEVSFPHPTSSKERREPEDWVSDWSNLHDEGSTKFPRVHSLESFQVGVQMQVFTESIEAPFHTPCPMYLFYWLFICVLKHILYHWILESPHSSSVHNAHSWGESESEVVQLCLTLCDAMDCSLPGSSIHGNFQAWILEWVAISFFRGSSRPRDLLCLLHSQVGSL